MQAPFNVEVENARWGFVDKSGRIYWDGYVTMLDSGGVIFTLQEKEHQPFDLDSFLQMIGVDRDVYDK